MEIDWAGLRAAAIEAMRHAYAPYSDFPVGVAGLVDDGRVIVGCNVENASYGVGLCAECGLVSSPARDRRRPAGGDLLRGRQRSAADAVRALPAAALGARRAAVPGRGAAPAADRWPSCCRTPSARTTWTRSPGRRPATRCRPSWPSGGGGAPSSCTPTCTAASTVWTGYWERSAGSPQESDDAKGVLEEAPNFADHRRGGVLGAGPHATDRGGGRRRRPDLGRRGRTAGGHPRPVAAD